jgi:hypothetical protein
LDVHFSAGLERCAPVRLGSLEESLVSQAWRFGLFFIFFCGTIFALGQAREGQTASGPSQKNAASDKPSETQPADVAGDWQMSWTGRLGTEDCAVHIKQDGAKLSGTFQDVHGLSTLTGTVEAKQVSFDVQFGGPRPFTTRFTGTADGGKIEGTSQAVGVGGSGAFLGHAGEVVHPEHPWTAQRVTNTAGETASNPNPPAKN